MPRPSVSAFICGASEDLRDERDAAIVVVSKASIVIQTMEHWGANPLPPIETCLRRVSESDFLVVIVGDRYGTLVPGRDISYSHAEYEHACGLGMPSLVYLKKQPQGACASPSEGRFAEWKQDLSRQTTFTFASIAEFAAHVGTDVLALKERLLASYRGENATATLKITNNVTANGTLFVSVNPLGSKSRDLARKHSIVGIGEFVEIYVPSNYYRISVRFSYEAIPSDPRFQAIGKGISGRASLDVELPPGQTNINCVVRPALTGWKGTLFTVFDNLADFAGFHDEKIPIDMIVSRMGSQR